MLSCDNMLYCNFAVQVSTISQYMYFKVVTKLYLLQWRNFKFWALCRKHHMGPLPWRHLRA